MEVHQISLVGATQNISITQIVSIILNKLSAVNRELSAKRKTELAGWPKCRSDMAFSACN